MKAEEKRLADVLAMRIPRKDLNVTADGHLEVVPHLCIAGPQGAREKKNN